MINSLMRLTLVAVMDISLYALAQLRTVIGRVQIGIIVFQGPEEPLNENIFFAYY
jgi:hypothetical protein